MDSEIVTAQPLEFFGGNVCLPVELKLPAQITFDNFTFYAKTEFHCSLICVKCIVKALTENQASNAESLKTQILMEVEAARKENEPVFIGYKNELRHVTQDDNQSIVILVDIGKLEPIFEHLRDKFQINLPSQPTHVTLYTLIPDKGIGIYSATALEATILIGGDVLEQLKSDMNFKKQFVQAKS
jgi:hypothetical protein